MGYKLNNIKILIVVMIYLSSIAVLRSQSNIDSLLYELEKPKHDTSQVNLLKEIAHYYCKNKPKEADEHISRYRNFGDKINDSLSMINTYIFTGIKEAMLGDLNKSSELFSKSYDLAMDMKFHHEASKSLMNIGINSMRFGQFVKSSRYLDSALVIAFNNNDVDMLGAIYSSLGILNIKLENYDNCIEFYEKSIDYYKKTGNKSSISMVYNNLSNVYLKLKDTVKALAYIDEGIKLDTESGDLKGLAIALHNKASVLSTMGRNNEALNLIERSKSIKEEIGNIIGVGFSHLGIGELNYRLKKFPLATESLQKAVAIFEDKGIMTAILVAYTLLDSLYLKEGKYSEAYKYSKLYHKINDSLHNIETEQAIEELNTKVKLSEKDRENEKLIIESERQEYIIIIFSISLAFIFVLAIVAFIRHRSIKQINNELNDTQMRIENQNTELEALNDELTETNLELNELNGIKDKFFSIIAHDLKGPVSTNFQLLDVLKNDYNDLPDEDRKDLINIIGDASKNTYSLLENLLTWSRSQLNKLDFNPTDIIIKDIVSMTIENLKSTAVVKDIQIDNLIDDNINIFADYGMLTFIFRNLASNAIKFTINSGKIEIKNGKDDSGQHVFLVTDNGVGMTKTTIDSLFKIDKTRSKPGTSDEKGTGLGLILCKEFVEKHNGKIWVESKEGEGTTFFFTLNLKD